MFTREALDNTELLISMVAGLGLDLALPPGIPTHLHNVTKKWTRLDQVLILEELMESIISCDVLKSTPGVNTDHIPILTVLDLNLMRIVAIPPRNFQNVDQETFVKALAVKLDKEVPPSCIYSPKGVESACQKLTEALQETINNEVPTIELRIKAKKCWTKELTKLRQEANKKGRKVSKFKGWPEHHLHRERKEANKQFHKTLEHTKRQHWRDWLEKADDLDIWTMHKYTSSPAGDRGKSRIPVLKVTHNGQEVNVTMNEEKSNVLAKTFLPPRPPEDMPIQFMYPKPICEFEPILKEQIKRQLVMLKPYKALGPDGIPNIILTKCANTITDRLYYIYRAMLELGTYYKPWRTSTTVVLCKPGKPHYNIPKAYRPIALLNTMSKVLTVLMANLMIFYTETHQLLPAHHFGGRPGRTTMDAVHPLVHKIKDTWCNCQVTAVLFLDIEGAFPNTVTSKLVHSMKKRHLPKVLVNFVKMMLDKRATRLPFDDHMLDPILLDKGNGQGDPLSMALYQYYNADILKIPSSPHELVEAYVDSAILTATAKTFKEVHNVLADMMNRPGGMIEWSKSHNSSIEYSKLALINFAHPGVKKTCPP